jgi:hypothetical protein
LNENLRKLKRNNMAYTQELINEVKELYPNSPEMHKLAENGAAFLGRYLDDSCDSGISLSEILLATSLDELQKKAREIKELKLKVL